MALLRKVIAAQAGTRIRHSLVGGLFIPQWESREEATVIIGDPEQTDAAAALKEASTEALEIAAVQLVTAQHFALAGNWNAANVLSARSVEELKTASDPLRRALDRGPTEGSRTMPFSLDELNAPVGALEFRFDVERLTGHLQHGRDVVSSLGAVAEASRERPWRQESSADDKSAAITTPYDVDLSLTVDFGR